MKHVRFAVMHYVSTTTWTEYFQTIIEPYLCEKERKSLDIARNYNYRYCAPCRHYYTESDIHKQLRHIDGIRHKRNCHPKMCELCSSDQIVYATDWHLMSLYHRVMREPDVLHSRLSPKLKREWKRVKNFLLNK